MHHLEDMSKVDKYVESVLSLPHSDTLSPYTTIPHNQAHLIACAKEYEEGTTPLVSDAEYDMCVRNLQRAKAFFPTVWEEVSLPVFLADDSWTYTGTFYKQGEE